MRAGIAGAGIMGQLLALELSMAGHKVSIFDQSSARDNCSYIAAGLLTPFSELDRASYQIFQLGRHSMQQLWPKILELIPQNLYFQKTGTMVVHHPQDKAEWEVYSRRIKSRLPQEDFSISELSQEQITNLEPALNRFDTAYYFAEEAHLDCEGFMSALQIHLQTSGINYYLHTKVLSLKPGIIETENKDFSFDMVFDCRGLGAMDVFPEMRALRGELIYVHAPNIQMQRAVRFLHPRYSLYLVPRPGSHYIIGASEIEAQDYSPISVRTTLELLTALYYLNPAFAEARIIKTSTHCRPTLMNHEPCIKYSDGLVAVNGLYRHGYLIAPALAAEIMHALSRNFKTFSYPAIWEHYHA